VRNQVLGRAVARRTRDLVGKRWLKATMDSAMQGRGIFFVDHGCGGPEQVML
jgi:hypothetical protein